MATLTAAKAASTVTRKVEHQGDVSVVSIYALTAALALNDILQMVRIPKGAVVLAVELGVDDLDTGGSPAIVLQVGDTGSATRFIGSNTVGQAGGVARTDQAAGVGYTYAADDTIQIKVSTGPQTGATSGLVRLRVTYTNDA